MEFVYAERPTGRGLLTKEKLDGLIALGYGYVNWGMMWEHIRCELTEPKLAFLESGRIGVSDRREDDMSRFLYLKTLEGVENKDRAYRESEGSGDEAGTSDSEAYDSEFEAEFGVMAHEIFMFGMAMAFVGFEEGMPSAVMDYAELVSKLKERKLSDKVISKGFDCFAFPSRNGWNDFGAGFSEEDILPWRFGRKLSLARKPILVFEEGGIRKVLWGPRHTNRCAINLVSSVYNGRFHQDDAKSLEMKRGLGKILNLKGKRFNDRFVAWLNQKTSGWKVEPNVPIKPGKKLSGPKDLGDIDCLAIDPVAMVVYLIECKTIVFGRTPSEMKSEVNKLFSDDGNSKVDKHVRRAEWVFESWRTFCSAYGLSGDGWRIVPLMLLENEIGSTHFVTPSIPVISFTEVQRKGITAFQELVDGKSTKYPAADKGGQSKG